MQGELPNHDYELLQGYLGCDAASFPLRLPSCPPEPEGRSRRLRQRWASKLALWKIVCRWVHFLNFLYSSKWHGSQRHVASVSSGTAHHAAEDVLLRQLWRKAKLEREGRRQYRADAGTGGRSAAAELVKNARFQDGYWRILKSPSQVPLRASLVAEPNDDTFVDMLTALPQVEADFYAKEANCIDWTGKSRVIQSELEEQYGFVGGSYDEYVRYFHRQDLPQNMWTWRKFSDVKAISGFACVPKKDGISQRKLLMSCSFNYLLTDVEQRSRLGMAGAGALSRVHFSEEKVSAAVCDQSNAFTSVMVPSWFYEYQATPPVPAKVVWTLLPCEVQDTVEEHSWVCPCYMRLPMGCSHSVHILMSINMRIIGMTLRSSTLLAPGDRTFRASFGNEEDKGPESQQQDVLDAHVELQGPLRQTEQLEAGSSASDRHGPSYSPNAAPFTVWSLNRNDKGVSVKILNEAAEEQSRVELSSFQMAVYLHVDDTLVLGNGVGADLARPLIEEISQNMEAAGFRVPDRRHDKEVEKVVGFRLDMDTGTFTLPVKRARLLERALLELAHARWVDVDVLRAVLGVWSFGAQLRRDLYSIPFVVYRMIELCEGQFVRQWPSVRDELICMARAVTFMEYEGRLQFSDVLFATDAMGADDLDCGGYGIVMTKINNSERQSLLHVGEAPGLTISNLNGSLDGLRDPHKELKRSKPFCRLPDALFHEGRWIEVLAGRWRHADHITIGEARAVTKLLAWLSQVPSLVGRVLFSLEDNRPCACAMTKGRSSSWGLNFYLRRRTAYSILCNFRLFLPWCQSSLMPADQASRRP